MVLCQPELAEAVDRGCPLVLGGPLPNVMAAKAVALAEARQPGFREYAQRIVANAQALADGLIRRGARLVTGGTDNHLVLIDVGGYGLTGRQAEQALLDAGIVTNRNAIPRDPNGAWYTSGIRIGTPALTTRGLGTGEMDVIAGLIHEVLSQARPGTTSSGAPSKAACAAGPRAVRPGRQAGRRAARPVPALPLGRPGLSMPRPAGPAGRPAAGQEANSPSIWRARSGRGALQAGQRGPWPGTLSQ